jgi:hypothetical protein
MNDFDFINCNDKEELKKHLNFFEYYIQSGSKINVYGVGYDMNDQEIIFYIKRKINSIERAEKIKSLKIF